MARQCEICGKTYKKIVRRSHSMRSSINRLQPNLQKLKVDGKKIKACTRCLRTQSKKEKILTV